MFFEPVCFNSTFVMPGSDRRSTNCCASQTAAKPKPNYKGTRISKSVCSHYHTNPSTLTRLAKENDNKDVTNCWLVWMKLMLSFPTYSFNFCACHS
ncbi:unnamed protein product [Anisakis simplex]|uniref:Ovule protein n=1 Tax=Anisakis simplex TaxID=6269 RepID=A0A0M3JTZ2_ANISI|nr:unnamed protein product [Anisakis simplex]